MLLFAQLESLCSHLIHHEYFLDSVLSGRMTSPLHVVSGTQRLTQAFSQHRPMLSGQPIA